MFLCLQFFLSTPITWIIPTKFSLDVTGSGQGPLRLLFQIGWARLLTRALIILCNNCLLVYPADYNKQIYLTLHYISTIQCLTCSRPSINIFWMNKWVSEWRPGIHRSLLFILYNPSQLSSQLIQAGASLSHQRLPWHFAHISISMCVRLKWFQPLFTRLCTPSRQRQCPHQLFPNSV